MSKTKSIPPNSKGKKSSWMVKPTMATTIPLQMPFPSPLFQFPQSRHTSSYQRQGFQLFHYPRSDEIVGCNTIDQYNPLPILYLSTTLIVPKLEMSNKCSRITQLPTHGFLLQFIFTIDHHLTSQHFAMHDCTMPNWTLFTFVAQAFLLPIACSSVSISVCTTPIF